MEENREDNFDSAPNESPDEQLQEGEEALQDADSADTDGVTDEQSIDTDDSESVDNEDDDKAAPSQSPESESQNQAESGEDGKSDENLENGDGDQGEQDPQEVIGKLGDDLALARADLYNLRNEYTNYVRRSKDAMSEHRGRGHSEVLEALIPVLDDIYAAREAGDLQEGPFAAIADKLENVLATNYDFERYGKAGEEFDPNLHEALMANESNDVEVETIAQVLQPGYKKGESVLRATKVIVDNPA